MCPCRDGMEMWRKAAGLLMENAVKGFVGVEALAVCQLFSEGIQHRCVFIKKTLNRNNPGGMFFTFRLGVERGGFSKEIVT